MWIAAIVLAAMLIGVVGLAMRRRHRGRNEPESGPQSWDETRRPTDDPFFENQQYYSRQ